MEQPIMLLYLIYQKDFPLLQAEALQIVERLVWRATASARYLTCSLKTDSTQVWKFDFEYIILLQHSFWLSLLFQLPMAIFKLASFDVPGAMSRPSIQLVVYYLFLNNTVSCMWLPVILNQRIHSINRRWSVTLNAREGERKKF